MVYRTCSVNKVIGQIYRDFRPSHSGWINDAIEWIGDAIEVMGVHQGYEVVNVTVKVIDFRAKLPCDLKEFLGVEHNNMRLQRSGAINQKNRCSCLDNMVCHDETKSYSLNPGYVQTTFTDENITIYYYGLKVDCDGFPEVPDNALYREALTYFVMMKMCGRGFKHQTFDYKSARGLWMETYPRAQNDCNYPDIDNYELFKKSWLGLARSTNLTNEFFNTIRNTISSANATTFDPNAKLETFPLIGTNTENPTNN